MNKNAFYKGLGVFGAVIILVMVGLFYYFNTGTVGSVKAGNEYRYASSTGALTKTLRADNPATLGSITIVKATAQAFVVWNATSTTDISSTTVVTLPASIATGTYTFDIIVPRGLVIVPAASFAGEYITSYR
jgi:hypothetical protein